MAAMDDFSMTSSSSEAACPVPCHRVASLFHGVPKEDRNGASLTPAVLLVLNGEGLTRRLLEALVGHSARPCPHRVACADGGAIRLFDLTHGSILPDWIRGDLDSLRDDVRSFYESRGTEINAVADDQDTTDFEKCLDRLLREGTTSPIVVLGWEGGRMDQHLGVFHSALRFAPLLPAPIYLISEVSVSTCLAHPLQRIVVDAAVEGPSCGVLPLRGPSRGVRTRGLEWELDGTATLEMGAFVSSSNRVRASVVEVEVPGTPVMWTCELRLFG